MNGYCVSRLMQTGPAHATKRSFPAELAFPMPHIGNEVAKKGEARW
jgi:hypothetical protein